MDSQKEYRTTFTPEGEIEEDKQCMGECQKVLPATRFKFKYETRNEKRGKVRNSICTKCSYNKTRERETDFQLDTKTRLGVLEEQISEMRTALDDISETVESLQLMMIKLSGAVEKLKKRHK